MATHTALAIDDIEGLYGGSFKKARAALGISSFGLQIIDLPPNATGYPEHDHAADGQEEVYVALSGAGELEIEGERVPLDPDHVVSVRPGVRRKVLPGDAGLRILVIGGVPGAVYAPPPFTELEALGPGG